MHTRKLIILFSFIFISASLNAQEMGAVDRSDVQWGETAEREVIKASELPTEVLKGFETSDYSDMKIMGVQKIIARPLKDSEDPYRAVPEDSLMDGKKMEDTEMLDSAYADRPYRMREDNRDIAETYYQDTYDNVETLSDSLMVEDVYKDTNNTYYEIEVDGEVASYKLIFNDEGDIRHTEIMEM
jgi:hypothetical protein